MGLLCRKMVLADSRILKLSDQIGDNRENPDSSLIIKP